MQRHRKCINNDFYDSLNEGWYSQSDHPIALFRSEHELLIPWIIDNLSPMRKILDIGCGAGLVANALALKGHRVTGIDLSETSLQIAKTHDKTHTVLYQQANAYSLPFPDGQFDSVCAIDVLQHVEEPSLLISEAARVLKPKGTLFFHTFNRSMMSYLVAIKAIQWLMPKTPPNMHVYSYFIPPEDLESIFDTHKLEMQRILGVRPTISKELWHFVTKRKVPCQFSFCFSTSLKIGYCGFARKRGNFTIR
jgi:2-polyprenyl-6-hydroxyphenyl methylase/3-demethylubiquinone-9 3-methyltransferase